ncbi:MAG: porin [Acidobacteriia bacterium]|nr:porin [Terriglobia bacterium]
MIALASFWLASISYAQDQASAPPPTNDTILRQMQELQEEVKALRAEVSALKGAPPSTPASPSAPAPAAAVPAQAAVTSASAPATTPVPTGLAGLLGPTTLSGFVDTYYGFNPNHPSTRQNGLRNFDVNSNQFSLNMIELVADKSVDTTNRLGYHLALGFGQAMNMVNSASPTELGFDQYLKEGYLEYMAPVGKGLQINVGKFVTPNGAEVIETKDNWNYSRSLLFSWAIPYFHFGASAKYAFNSKFAVTGYLVNGWNNSIDNNTGKTLGASFAWTPNAKFSVIENYMGGPEQSNDNQDWRHLLDTVITYNPTPKLSFIANYDYGHEDIGAAQERPFTLAKWSGLAGYVKYAPNDKWAIALRAEYFDDNQGWTTGTAQELSEFTATLQRAFSSKLISRLEFRRDMTDSRTFLRGPANTPVSGQNTVALGLIYAFSSADAK